MDDKLVSGGIEGRGDHETENERAVSEPCLMVDAEDVAKSCKAEPFSLLLVSTVVFDGRLEEHRLISERASCGQHEDCTRIPFAHLSLMRL